MHAFPELQVLSQSYLYSPNKPGWRLGVVVELVEDTDGGRFYSHANITGEPVPWDMPFDRARKMHDALELTRMGFHL